MTDDHDMNDETTHDSDAEGHPDDETLYDVSVGVASAELHAEVRAHVGLCERCALRIKRSADGALLTVREHKADLPRFPVHRVAELNAAIDQAWGAPMKRGMRRRTRAGKRSHTWPRRTLAAGAVVSVVVAVVTLRPEDTSQPSRIISPTVESAPVAPPTALESAQNDSAPDISIAATSSPASPHLIHTDGGACVLVLPGQGVLSRDEATRSGYVDFVPIVPGTTTGIACTPGTRDSYDASRR